MQHRRWLAGLVLGLGLPLANAAEPWIFAVSEGTSGNSDSAAITARFEPLIRVMEQATGHDISVVIAREFKRLEEDMKASRYEFVMARPSDYPARGVRDYGYKLVATAKPDGRCYIIVPKDSPYNSLKDVSGKRFAFSEQASYTTKLCLAELRDQGITVNKTTAQFMREQDGVGFAVSQKIADVGGVASYSALGQSWEKNGGRILHQSGPRPYFPMIASSKISPQDLAKIQAALQQLEKTESGQKLLASLNIKGFNIESEKRLLDLLKWIE